jgi:creatinine amidohydrolase/Fe(II)-dependent formamide hydrolase-like protein
MRLANLTSPEVRVLPFERLAAIAPLGAFEQHGPHLPLTTDTDIVTAIAEAAERAMPDRVLLLPCLWLGHSTHHMHFRGTLDVRQMHYITRKADMQYLKPVYAVNEFHQISESVVIGHTNVATSEKGRRFFDAIVRDVVAFLKDLLTW